MKVILNEDVKNLGEEGDIVTVKNGYARNFLLPKGWVLPCTKGNLSLLAQKKEAIEKRKAQKREAAKSLKERIESTSLTLQVPAGDTGKLFGSVNNATIAAGLLNQGIEVERKRIEVVGTHVKMVGHYQARIKLYGDEVALLKFSVEGVSSTAAKGAQVASAAAAPAAAEPAPAAAAPGEGNEAKADEPTAEAPVTEVRAASAEDAAGADEEAEAAADADGNGEAQAGETEPDDAGVSPEDAN